VSVALKRLPFRVGDIAGGEGLEGDSCFNRIGRVTQNRLQNRRVAIAAHSEIRRANAVGMQPCILNKNIASDIDTIVTLNGELAVIIKFDL